MLSLSASSGSRKIWWLSRSEKRTTLSSIEGQYLGPRLEIAPECIADRDKFKRTIRCVFGVVRVIWHGSWGVITEVVQYEKNSGGSSPSWTSRPAQSIVLPSNLGGVPVLSLARFSPATPRLRAKAPEARSPKRPATTVVSPR